MFNTKFDNDETYLDVIQKGTSRFLEEKAEIVEGILEELLQCRSWTEIATMCRTTFGTDNECNPQEHWYFKDKKILTVTLKSTDEGVKFVYEGYQKEAP